MASQFEVVVKRRSGEDKISITIVPGGPPVVLTAAEAKALSRAIADAVRTVKRSVGEGGGGL